MPANPTLGRPDFTVGPVFAAALLCMGSQTIVRGLRRPLTALLIRGINFLIVRSYPDTIPLGDITFVWVAQLPLVIGGILLVVAGFWLGGWLRSDS